MCRHRCVEGSSSPPDDHGLVKEGWCERDCAVGGIGVQGALEHLLPGGGGASSGVGP